MLKVLVERGEVIRKIGVCSDSKDVVKNVEKLKKHGEWWRINITPCHHKIVKNIKFIHLSREFNGEADELAKSGSKTPSLVGGCEG